VTARELHELFTPSVGEIEWAKGLTRSAEHLLALVVLLKSFQRLGYFPDLYEVPVVVVDHVRGYLEMGAEVEVAHESNRTAERHGAVRDYRAHLQTVLRRKPTTVNLTLAARVDFYTRCGGA
jgi:hypothetical protein